MLNSKSCSVVEPFLQAFNQLLTMGNVPLTLKQQNRRFEMLTKNEIKNVVSTLPVLCDLESDKIDLVVERVTKFLEEGGFDNGKGESFINGVIGNLQDNPVFVRWCLRLILELSPKPAESFYRNIILGTVLDRNYYCEKFKKEHGIEPPVTIVINPTMRCNIKCRGCYAFNYRDRKDMDYELLKRVLQEAREMGVRLITLSGGEPLLYKDVFRMFEEFNDMNFLMYTNGTLIDRKTAEKFASLGNVMPGISVEGYEKETDDRRGRGIFSKIIEAMSVLRENGVLFGISCTPTSRNSDIMATDEFFDFWMEQGILFAWLFTYLPVGRDPDLSLVCTPEQRNRLRQVCHQYRSKKPLFIGDFWNDGGCVGGCLSASRYLYITSDGLVQPCTFVHFYTHSIKEHSLIEILKSPFFNAIREAQPYNPNLLLPCKIIDNPSVLRNIVKECGAKPSYEGAEHIIEDPRVVAFLDRYSSEFKKLADRAWEEEYSKGHSFVIPFIGRRDLWKFYGDRMSRAEKNYRNEKHQRKQVKSEVQKRELHE